jgi:hypothetical protein
LTIKNTFPFNSTLKTKFKSIIINVRGKKMKENLNRKYYTPGEVADFFGRSKDGIYLSIKLGQIPVKKLGRRYYIPSDFVHAANNN